MEFELKYYGMLFLINLINILLLKQKYINFLNT